MIDEIRLNCCRFLLRVTYVAIPLAAGADKFFNYLTNWIQYVNPDLITKIPFQVSLEQCMYGVGVIEIGAGLLVLINPRWGGLVVAAWLSVIIVNLVTMGQFYDIAVRDAGLAVGALVLSCLSK